MSVTVIDPVAGPYTPNGATVAFAFDFKIATTAEIAVFQDGTEVNPADYSVALAVDLEGGTVTYDTAPATGSGDIYLVSDPLFTQTAAFNAEGPFSPSSLNGFLDRSAIRDVYLKEQIDRSIRAPVGGVGIVLESGQAGLIGIDADGNAEFHDEGEFVGATGPAGDVAKAANRAALAAIAGPTADATRFLAESGREGLFKFTSGDLSAQVTADTAQGIYVAPTSDATGAAGAWVRQASHFEPEWFGATGDGVADDYAAFTALATVVSYFGAGRVELGRGKTYHIGQYRTAANGVAPLQFEGCAGLTIEGNGAKLDFKGDFDRAVSTDTGIGIQLTDCTGVIVRNLELDGNVDQMTNSGNSTEHNSAVGINVRSSNDVLFQNVHSHHFATDGFAMRSGGAEVSPGVNRASRRVAMQNCRGEYNGRGNLTIAGCRTFTADNCDFSNAAQFTGAYTTSGVLGHAPRYGFDLEPTNSAFGGDQDVNDGEIMFRNCRFVGSFGAAWSAALENASDTISFIGCRVEVADTATVSSAVNIGIPRTTVRDCYFDMKGRRFELRGGGGLATHIFEGNEVRGDGSDNILLYAPSNSKRSVVRNNRIISTATVPSAVALWNLSDNNLVFEGNHIFIPKESYVDSGANDSDVIGDFGGIRRHARNRYETDLLAASGSAGQAHFYFNHGTEAVDEVFAGTAPGIADTFRPAAGGTFDTNFKYSKGRTGYLGVPGKTVLTNAAFTYQHGRDAMHMELAVALTVARALALSTTDATEGAEAIVVRTAASTGAFNLNVGTGPLKALATGQWARFRYSGAAWTLTAFGSL